MTDCVEQKQEERTEGSEKEQPLPGLEELAVLVVHNDVSESTNPSECDVLDEVAAVCASLERLGLAHAAVPLADPRAIAQTLASAPVHGRAGTVVWNLFENTVGRWYSGTFLEAALPVGAEVCGHGCVGADSLAMWLTTDKAATRRALERAGVRIPRGVHCVRDSCTEASLADALIREGLAQQVKNKDGKEDKDEVKLLCDVIVKPASADGSEGIEWDRSVFRAGAGVDGVWARVAHVCAAMRMDALVEALVGDAELNVSLVADPVLRVAAVADIDFAPLPPGLPRIVDFAGKWTPASPMYASVRRLPSALDAPTARLVRDVALRAFRAAGMRDYGRVDMRCDLARGHVAPDRLWVIEVNANPCVSPGSGFHDGLVATGTPFDAFVRSMVLEAYRRSKDYDDWLSSHRH